MHIGCAVALALSLKHHFTLAGVHVPLIKCAELTNAAGIVCMRTHVHTIGSELG